MSKRGSEGAAAIEASVQCADRPSAWRRTPTSISAARLPLCSRSKLSGAAESARGRIASEAEGRAASWLAWRRCCCCQSTGDAAVRSGGGTTTLLFWSRRLAHAATLTAPDLVRAAAGSPPCCKLRCGNIRRRARLLAPHPPGGALTEVGHAAELDGGVIAVRPVRLHQDQCARNQSQRQQRKGAPHGAVAG